MQISNRVNAKIRAREVRTIDVDGAQLGVLPLNEALRRAQQKGLDLVEVAPNAQPPVCRIVDFGKFRYEQTRKEREARKHQHTTKVKKLKFHANISEHDYGVKLRHIQEFLQANMRVKVSLVFRGREMTHKELGENVLNRLVTDCAEVGHAETEQKLMGKSIHMMLAPRPASKRPKHSTETDQGSSSGTSGPSASPKSGFVNAPKIVLSNQQPN